MKRIDIFGTTGKHALTLFYEQSSSLYQDKYTLVVITTKGDEYTVFNHAIGYYVIRDDVENE